MAGVHLHIELEGFAEALNGLGALAALDQAELLDQAAGVVEDSTTRRFETKLAPDGTPWADWSGAYQPKGQGHTILHRDGDLRDSIAAVVEGMEARVGSDRAYAAIHQFGGAEVGRPGLPARPYLGFTREDERNIRKAFETYLAARIKEGH